MFEALSIIVVFLFLLATSIKTWKLRHILLSLSSSDWIQFFFGILMSLAFASIVVIAVIHQMDDLITGIAGGMLKMTIILVGIFITSVLFIKLIPDKLKPFYKLLEP